MRKKIFILLIIIIVGGAVMTVFFCRKNKYKDLRVYTEKLLEVEWNDCIETATGDVEREMWEEDWANIKLGVKEGYEEDVLNILRNSFGEPSDISRVIVPDYQGHEFAAEIRNGDLQYIFKIYMEGEWAKTRNIRIYVVYDEKGQMYIYIMG
ncbi:MAG: hypothetical protein HDQ99_19700 [Lachnospiraceae bacterium]|nr:hypothetical protein [Lachnospiraceae bacterium]